MNTYRLEKEDEMRRQARRLRKISRQNSAVFICLAHKPAELFSLINFLIGVIAAIMVFSEGGGGAGDGLIVAVFVLCVADVMLFLHVATSDKPNAVPMLFINIMLPLAAGWFLSLYIITNEGFILGEYGYGSY